MKQLSHGPSRCLISPITTQQQTCMYLCVLNLCVLNLCVLEAVLRVQTQVQFCSMLE